MNWLEDIFDSDARQRADLNRQGERMSRIENSARMRSDDLGARVKNLEAENTELKVVCRALLQTLIDRDLITKESFTQLAQQIEVEHRKQNDCDDRRIFPKLESPETQIKIDFSSARQKPESFNS